MGEKKLTVIVGLNIAKRRKELGLSQEILAEKVEISQESLSRMDKGVIASKFERLQLFAEALHCNVADLFRSSHQKTEGIATSIADMLEPLSIEQQEEIIAIMSKIVQIANPKIKHK